VADLDQVPLVDFCNQFQSTSTTTGSTDPRSELVDAARPACAGLGGDLRMGLKPSAMPTTGSGWCRATLDAGPSLATRDRHVVLHQPRFHGSGTGRLSPPGAPLVWPALLRDAGTVTRASPQPDPLGHLMSRDRGAPGGEPDALRPPPQTSWCGTPPTIPPHGPCSHTCARERRARVAPARTRLRGVHAPRAEGRFTRTSAKRAEIGCTRGAFHR
jgi:hypothetical protein